MSILKSALARMILLPVATAVALTVGSAAPALASVPVATAAAPASATATGTSVSLVAPTLKTYTMAQVKRHNKKSNCWTVVGTGVYKLTGFIKKHPGGSKRIIAMCGKNSTAAFRAQHGSVGKAARVLKKYKIGKLA